MTTFENRSTKISSDDRDNDQRWDSHHQQRAGLATAGDVMSAWTVAGYDYAEQVLKAQRQFFHSMLAVGAPMLDVARDITSPDVNEDRSANNQLDARNDQRHDGSDRSRKNEGYNDGDTQAGESAKTRAPVAASAPGRKRP